jgi:hypothetical protein
LNELQSTPSIMIYLGRSVPPENPNGLEYVNDYLLNKFLDEQSYFDSFTIWKAEGSWRGLREDTCVVEVFDTDIDIIIMFAQLYIANFSQEAVYIKIANTPTLLLERK